MKKLLIVAAFVVLSGCQSMSPYDYLENWLIREDPVRTFVVPADLIYVQGDLYTKMSNVPMMFDYAKSEVGNDRFNGLARVFSPLVATPEDIDAAMEWYFKYHHKPGRTFFFIGEGEGGRMLKEYEQQNAKSLKKEGLELSFYTDEYRKGFVTDEMVHEIKSAIARARFRKAWDKGMPDGMLE